MLEPPVGVAPFVLDIYPVTVRQFRGFMAAGGYENAELWSERGWRWRSEENVRQPRFWDETDWSEFLQETHPVIGVSVHEAEAYARFVDRRLPREDEWRCAAGGERGSTFPWGEQWEEGRVGNRGVGPRCTWPVGSWPQSVGPYGHHDLVGNVWQWMADDWRPGQRQRAARGGSWACPPKNCRTDHRNGWPPEGRHSHIGFRTARDIAC